MKKKLTALLLALALALCALPAAALDGGEMPAGEGLSTAESGEQATIDAPAVPEPDEGEQTPDPAPEAAAEVDGQPFSSLEGAVAALTPGATLRLVRDASLHAMLELKVPGVTFDLGGCTLAAAPDFQSAGANASHLVNVAAEGVTLTNGTLTAGASNRHVVNVYRAAGVTLKDLTIDHTAAAAGAPLVVNASSVTVQGALALAAGPRSWYGINVDKAGASLAFAPGSAVTMEQRGTAGLFVIWAEGGSAAVTGAQAAGLVDNGDGTFGAAGDVPPATPAPSPVPTPVPTPEPAPTATPVPEITPVPEATPAPTAEPAATPAPLPTQEPAPTPAPTAQPSPRPSAVPSPTPAATPTGTEGAPGHATAPVEAALTGDTAVAAVEESHLTDTVRQALDGAARAGGAPAVTVQLQAEESARALEVSLPAAALAPLADAEGGVLTLDADLARVTFDPAALSSIVAQAGEGLVLRVACLAAEELTDAQFAAAGHLPVYELTLHSAGEAISHFEAGSVTVSLPYTLAPGRRAGEVTVWHVAEDGAATPRESRFDKAAGRVTFVTPRFSRYAIACGELAPADGEAPALPPKAQGVGRAPALAALALLPGAAALAGAALVALRRARRSKRSREN